ncbi:T9SS type A sorting domain-containing protein [Flavobacterium sp. RHBU_24]|uniref:T9SS type A sorting domain-containing protein n=1 Tax=Flavobacterium sp. RHBU_24 TaxID=3391185 RepID=UPI003984773D
MYGTETAYESSPADLIGITNAEQVFSVDYYEGTTRIAAGLATVTTGSVYDHSKMICDRLNGSSLEDVRTVTLQGHEIIMVKLKRANGITEYALTFSVEQTETSNLLHSYWNIAQYPVGNYVNFQVWGATMGQVSSVVNYTLDRLNQQASVTSDVIENRIPSVFVRKGSYKNGELLLQMINKSSSTTLNFDGNKRQTELSETENLVQTVSLDGNYNQDLTVDTNGIFDIGFSVVANNSPRVDGLYLADGPWGVDYNADETTINNFNIEAYTPQAAVTGVYPIERNAALTGEVKGTVNLFRNLLPGELTLDVSGYEALNFDLVSSHPVEVVMITEGLTEWANRLKFELPAQQSPDAKSISLNDFVNANGESFNGQLIKGFVFSIIGNYSTFEPFSINVSNMKLGNYSLGVKDVTTTTSGKFYNYPNPFYNSTTLLLPAPSDKISVQVLDLTGRKIISREVNTENGIEVKLDNLNLPSGTYIIRAVTNDNKIYQSKCIVK